MWGDQCNTCGGHENEIRFITPCTFCSTKICNGCKLNHEAVCEVTTQRKRRGEGPTVKAAQEIPAMHSIGLADGIDFNIPPKAPKVVANLPEATKVTSQVQDETAVEPVLDARKVFDQLLTGVVEALDTKLSGSNLEENAAKAALLATKPLIEALKENATLAARIDPAEQLAGLESPLTVGDVWTPVEPPPPGVSPAPVDDGIAF